MGVRCRRGHRRRSLDQAPPALVRWQDGGDRPARRGGPRLGHRSILEAAMAGPTAAAALSKDRGPESAPCEGELADGGGGKGARETVDSEHDMQ